jgi:hypothetical protein
VADQSKPVATTARTGEAALEADDLLVANGDLLPRTAELGLLLREARFQRLDPEARGAAVVSVLGHDPQCSLTGGRG